MTANLRYPDFFLVGAPKAGTTFLYKCLSDNPRIYCASIKEPHYFSCPEVKDTYYKVAFIESEQEYLNLYSEAIPSQLIGDFSPSYLHSAIAAQRIHTANPNARIIAILRNPVERAVSHYLMDVRHNYQRHDLSAILGSPERYPQFYKEYVEVGFYASQINRYERQFDKSQLLVLKFEDLVRNNRNIVDRVTEFLNLPRQLEITRERPNRHRQFKSRLLKAMATSRWTKPLRSIMPDTLKERLLGRMMTTRKPNLVQARHRLEELFRDEINRLELQLDMSLDDWRESGPSDSPRLALPMRAD